MCKGDSGGALLCNIDGQITFSGVLSRKKPYEESCGVAGHPGVFNDLYHFSEWIQQDFVTPEYYDLPMGYQLHSSRKFFYWIPDVDAMNFNAARHLCAPAGHQILKYLMFLPLPRSAEENEDFRKLSAGKDFWLGTASGAEQADYVDGVYVGSSWVYFDEWNMKDEYGVLQSSYTNWRSNDGIPAGLSSDKKAAAILRGSDGKWATAHYENEEHFALCIFRIEETAQTRTPVSFPASTPTAAPTTKPFEPFPDSPALTKLPINDYATTLRIKYQSAEHESGFSERTCIGTVIANNVILTSSACCENIEDFKIIDSSGGTNGMINTNGRYGGLGAHTTHTSLSYFSSSFVCKHGHNKNGKCKKAGKRRKREDGDETGDEDGDVAEMICILRTMFNVVEQFEKKPLKDRFKSHFPNLNSKIRI